MQEIRKQAEAFQNLQAGFLPAVFIKRGNAVFNVGDRVVVIAHEPDEDYRQMGEIPIGTEGIYDKSVGEAENPETGESEPTGWVLFDLPYEEHRWTVKCGQGIRACMFDSMLALAEENGCKSIAFCCISTGVFHFPPERAAQIAVETVREWLLAHEGAMDRVIFNVFTDKDRDIYEHLFK